MNAAVLADGYAVDGPEGAKAALERFWRRVSDADFLTPDEKRQAVGYGAAVAQRA